MRKLLFIIPSFILLFSLFLSLPKLAIATYTCKFIFDPPTPNQAMSDLGVTMETPDLTPGSYTAAFIRPYESDSDLKLRFDGTKADVEIKAGTGTDPNTAVFTMKKSSGWVGQPGDWSTGTYYLYILNNKAALNPDRTTYRTTYLCATSFSLVPAVNSCAMALENGPLNPNKTPIITINNIRKNDCEMKVGNLWGGYDLYLNGKEKTHYCTQVGDRIQLETLPKGDYKVELKERCGWGFLGKCKYESVCSPLSFRVCSTSDATCLTPPPSGPCKIELIAPRKSPLAEKDSAAIKITGIPPNEEVHVNLIKDSGPPREVHKKKADTAGLTVFQLFTNNAEIGKYEIQTFDSSDKQLCAEKFEVTKAGTLIEKKACKKDDASCTLAGGESCTLDEKNPGIKTAIGCIHTNPADLAKDLLKFGLGIGGGLSFLMMLFGAFQMMTSAGNPETLNIGRQRLTSAIIGLLFVILSILILQIIGWNILQLPGFGTKLKII